MPAVCLQVSPESSVSTVGVAGLGLSLSSAQKLGVGHRSEETPRWLAAGRAGVSACFCRSPRQGGGGPRACLQPLFCALRHRQQPTRLLCPWDSPCTHVYLRTYSCLENPVDRGAWWTAVHGVAKSRTRPSDLTSTFHFHALEKATVTHSSLLAWRIPGTSRRTSG